MENYELEEKGLPTTCKTMVGESKSALVHKHLNLHQIVSKENRYFGMMCTLLCTVNVHARK